MGVDGSEESKAALGWALEEARLRSADLSAVYAWSYPVVPGRGIVPPAAALPTDVLRREAEELLESTLAAIGGAETEAVVRLVAVEGTPTKVLVEASENAQLLVVGSRGHGGFVGLMLGSVSQQCALHAHCPVVIVRPDNSSAHS